MRFFVPDVKAEHMKAFHEAIRVFLDKEHGHRTTGRRIRRIVFTHDGERFDVNVGDRHPQVYEDVLVIPEDDYRKCYLICTWNRGVKRGQPYMVGERETSLVEDFDAGEAATATAAKA